MANDKTLPEFNPTSISDLEKRAAILADQQGFKKRYEIDAFRHAYTAAMMTKFKIGDVLTGTMGFGVEFAGLLARGTTDLFQSVMEFFGREYSKGERVHFDEQFLESAMDAFNNAGGIKIGNNATSEDDIIRQVTEGINNGELIRDPAEVKTRMEKERSESQSNFFAGEWDNQQPSSAGRSGDIDFAELLESLSKKTRGKKSSTSQIMLTSAAALASSLLKARKKSQEDVILNMLTGKDREDIISMQRNGGGGMFDEISGQISLPGIFSNLAERMVSAALSRQRTRTSSAESERSRETARNWNLSQGQHQAMLAQWVQRGNRNL